MAAVESPAAEGPTGNHRVLLVEDDPRVRRLVARDLSAWSYDVDVAEAYDEALRKCRTNTYDLVLSDVMIPGNSNGYDLALWIRQHQPRIPVVLMSGYAGKYEFKTQFPFLRKPYDPDELKGLISGVLG